MTANRLRGFLLAASLSVSIIQGSAGWARPLYTYFLFHPKKELKSDPEQINGIVKEDVVIRAGNISLSGWFFRNSSSPYVVLVSHGNGGNIASVSWIAHNLLSAGVSVLVYDYRGYGSSKGQPTAKSICADGDAAYDFLHVQKGFTPEHIILYGQSLGCAVACHIAKGHHVAAMILQSGFSSLRNVAYEHFPILKHAPSYLVPNVLDNASILSHSDTPLLLIHGDKDRVVPFLNAHQLYDAAHGEKQLTVCHNSGHRLFPEADAQHRAAVTKFIAQITGYDKSDGSQAESEPVLNQ